jgi:hypothetical protein
VIVEVAAAGGGYLVSYLYDTRYLFRRWCPPPAVGKCTTKTAPDWIVCGKPAWLTGSWICPKGHKDSGGMFVCAEHKTSAHTRWTCSVCRLSRGFDETIQVSLKGQQPKWTEQQAFCRAAAVSFLGPLVPAAAAFRNWVLGGRPAPVKKPYLTAAEVAKMEDDLKKEIGK